MTNEVTKNEIALLRYGAILPVLHDDFPEASARKYFERVAQTPFLLPDGSSKYFAVGTMTGWLLAYRKSGFQGLLPKTRNDKGGTRALSDEQKAIILERKRTRPRRTATSIYWELIEQGVILKHACSLASVQRFLASKRHEITAPYIEDMKAFEMKHANDLWQIDTSHGPFLTIDGKRYKTYMIMIIDDASRLLVGHDIFLADNAVNVQLVVKQAVAIYGVPKKLYTDNGTPYRNKQLELICAHLGVGLCRTQVYHGNQKGKIERNFKSVKEGWMYNIDYDDFASTSELHASLAQYVSKKNNSHHAALQTTPWLRFMEDKAHIRKIDATLLEQAFLHTEQRRVNNDATIKLRTQLYEVDQTYIGRHVTIKYQPDCSIVYLYDEEQIPTLWLPLKLVNKVDNSQIKRKQPLLTGGDM